MNALRRSRRFEHVDTEGSWAVSYGDMITLLLSFFVLFFTVDHKKNRAHQMQSSLLMRLEQNGVSNEKSGGIKSPLNIGPEIGDNIDVRVLAHVGAKVHDYGDFLLVEFTNVSFFNLGIVDVNQVGQAVLQTFASVYQPFAGRYDLVVRAFTDTRPVKSKSGRFKDNLELSALRSVAAMRVLQSAGVPLKDMRIAGLGETRIPGQTESDANRAPTAEDALRYARKVMLIIEPKRSLGDGS